jgi:subtilisin family serine protease
VIAVGATGPDDNRYSASPTAGSNYGDELDLVAPGSFIYMLDMHNFNQYISGSGSSCSAAFVTGVVSLLLAQNPTLTPAQVQDILQKSADDQVGDPKEDTKGWDKYYGWGRLNAYKALTLSTAVEHPQYRPQISAKQPLRAFALINNPFPAVGNWLTLDGRIIATHAATPKRFINAAKGVYIHSPIK